MADHAVPFHSAANGVSVIGVSKNASPTATQNDGPTHETALYSLVVSGAAVGIGAWLQVLGTTSEGCRAPAPGAATRTEAPARTTQEASAARTRVDLRC